MHMGKIKFIVGGLVFLVLFTDCDLNRDSRNYELQERCGKRAEEICKNQYPDGFCLNHYNMRLNKCIIHLKQKTPLGFLENLRDANENKTYGWASLWDDGQFLGSIQDKHCKDRQEWDKFVKKMIED